MRRNYSKIIQKPCRDAIYFGEHLFMIELFLQFLQKSLSQDINQ